MLISSLCPRLRIFSVSIFLVVVITIIYFTMLGVGGTAGGSNRLSFLPVSESTLIDFGGNDPNAVLQGQVFLWFSSVFLAYDFLNWSKHSM
jgi:ABC-type branched-subunit amino acid transport system permease subunit